MSDDRTQATTPAPPPPQAVPDLPPLEELPAPRRRMKWLRLIAIVIATALLGSVSFVFGVFVSVVSDLPSLTRFAQFKEAQSSVLVDDLGKPVGVLSQHNRVIVTPSQIPPIVKEAVISIEDKRFYSNSGIDIRGIARAFVEDLRRGGNVQGASTIEQQFIKNALQAQSHRTIFEKLREAALAYQLSHKWSKERILTAYLNTIYFGNGAYGIEAAAETYFGHDVNHLGCGTAGHELCVKQLAPWEAALLAGVIQSPTAYNPALHPIAARERRDVVLRQMLLQGYITQPIYEEGIRQALPSATEIQLPSEQKIEGVDAGYFTSWVQQQVIERYGPQRAFAGGLRVKTTLDLEMQKAAEAAVNSYLPGPEGPGAAMVVIENATGEVRAMVGGRDYEKSPFNLATEGERQPGSSFKAFDLATALENGISPESVWSSQQKTFVVNTSHGPERFVVHNDEGSYSGSTTLTGATAASDNSVYAEVGLKVGTHKIALLAHRMGITTPLSTNPAMTIGGLTVGVTPLDMAHAYETIAHGGERVSGTLAGGSGEAVGIQEVTSPSTLPDGSHRDINHVETRRVLAPETAATETHMLETVIAYGTGTAASLGTFAAGKTGTTSNFGDAWFVGWDSKYTVAVWVGYPDKLIPMTTDFGGQPVFGGTYPALIWKQFMLSAMGIDKARAEAAASHGQSTTGGSTGEVEATPQPAGTAPAATPASGGAQQKNGAPSQEKATAPAQEKPAAPSAPAEAPAAEKPAAPAGEKPASPAAGNSGGAEAGGATPSG